ncbi:MAG: DUF4339 domain-containing protein [Bdellovibrionales bacterium]|nr:GYF domain-containing protein [Bdellovibrionales bacterium]NQZ20047.1 DUF4339 domain-containing protein [Bdellovibrionales bacterium]
MEKEFLVRFDKKKFGKISQEELCVAISLGQIPFYSQVSSIDQKKWKPLHKEIFLAQIISQQIKSPTHKTSEGSIYGNWFVKNGDSSFGPFSLVQMIELCQQNNLVADSLVRHSSLKGWETLSQTKPFDDKSVKSLFKYPDLSKVFTQRKSPRVYYSNSVCLTRNRDELYSGMSLSLSKKGIGIILDEKANVKVKEKLNLIINRNSEHGMIQSKCEVVSFNQCDGQDRLGLVFDQEIEPLTEYIERRVPLIQAA